MLFWGRYISLIYFVVKKIKVLSLVYYYCEIYISSIVYGTTSGSSYKVLHFFLMPISFLFTDTSKQLNILLSNILCSCICPCLA